MDIPVKMPTSKSFTQFIFGAIVGYIVDQIAEFICWQIPAQYRPPRLFGILPFDDIFVFGAGVIMLFKRPAFGLGWIVGAALGSTVGTLSPYYPKAS